MKDTLKVVRNRYGGMNWYIAGRLNGQRVEYSTGTSVKADAERFLVNFVARLEEKPEEHRRAVPEAVALGEFERYLLETYQLDGEVVVRRWDGRPLKFHRGSAGYRFAEVPFRSGWVKKVLEHRLKFLLGHGWLPRTVDHEDRDRGNNALGNLRASTPALQSSNSARRRREKPSEMLPIWEMGW